MQAIGTGNETSGFRGAVRLAAALARPFATFDVSSCRVGALSPGETAAIARDQSFVRPVERAVLKAQGIDAMPLSASDIALLGSSAEGALALFLLADDIARLRAASALLAAATLQRHVLQLTNKIDRRRIKEILGAEAHLVATQEAPTLHPGLAIPAAGDVLVSAMADGLDVAAARRRIGDYGLALLWRFVVVVAPAFGDVMLLRLPASARARDLAALVAGVDERQARQFTRFMKRRVPAWSAITG